MLAVEWRWWSSGGQTSGGGSRIITSLLVVSTHRHRCRLSHAAPSPAAAPPPAAPPLVSMSIYLAVWTRHGLCLSCHRASSRCSIVISIVVEVVIIGLDVDVIGGFNVSSKLFILPLRLLPPLCRHCHCCCHCGHHRRHHSLFRRRRCCCRTPCRSRRRCRPCHRYCRLSSSSLLLSHHHHCRCCRRHCIWLIVTFAVDLHLSPLSPLPIASTTT